MVTYCAVWRLFCFFQFHIKEKTNKDKSQRHDVFHTSLQPQVGSKCQYNFAFLSKDIMNEVAF